MFSELENKAMAEVFGKEKAKVVLNYRSESHMKELDALQETIKKSGGDSITVQADVSVEEDVKRLVETAVKEFGTIDIMINNAGFEKATPSHEMSMAEWQKVLDINLTGAFIGSREAVKQFLKELLLILQACMIPFLGQITLTMLQVKAVLS